MKKYYCIDCKKEISNYRAKRCRVCYGLSEREKNNPAYIDGKSLSKKYCLNCNKEITYTAKLCLKCLGKIHKGYDNNSNKVEVKEKLRIQKLGNKNPNWNGGSSFKPYTIEFNNILKNQIRKRDNHKCQNCGTNEKDLKGYHKKLQIHHIDYNKDNCKETNLITLCLKCNTRANYNREYWKEFYRQKIESILGL